MKQQFKHVLLAGTAVLALSGAANAAVIDLNIYGASAQYLFWNASAPSFLTSVRKCAASPVQTATADNKSEITTGIGCDPTGSGAAGTGPNTINLRYASKASYDGIYAVKNLDSGNTCPGQPGQRKMVTASGNVATSCMDIHVGASDVAGASFTQESHGGLLGPSNLPANVATNRTFQAISTTGLTAYQPVVVPFGFFANNAIKVYTCDTAASGLNSAGNLCTTATATADCGTGTCTQKTIDNITREMAIEIFAGRAIAWTDFGDSYSVTGDADALVVACLRHAGSGTHSTLDYAVMKPAAQLATNQSTEAPIVYFNDGSGDEMKCVNNTFGLANPGAVGYADADQANLTNTVSLKYNGLLPRRNLVRNGAYDFFSNQWLFVNPSKVTTAQNTLIGQLNTYASNPANLPAAKKAYWATASEMVWNKTNDQLYPGYVGATNKQTP